MTAPLTNPISVVIPNWNGASLLEQFLPAILTEIARRSPESECIVVDDCSSDQSVELLKTRFPAVTIIRQPRNRGFASCVNLGIAQAVNAYVLLLNNDVAITSGFLEPLLRFFENNDQAFAVSSVQQQEGPKGRQHDGFNAARWNRGHIEYRNATDEVLRAGSFRLAYCNGGCSLFSRSKLLELGGFCDLFDPFYYEDAELGLQALKRGWQLGFARDSLVYHRHGTTTKRKPWKFRFVPVRNYFLLHWLTIDSSALWREHFSNVAGRLIGWTLQGRIRYGIGFILALAKLTAVRRERRKRGTNAKLNLCNVIRNWP